PNGDLETAITDAGRITDSMDTYEGLLVASDAPTLTEKALDARLNSYCHVVSEKFVTLAYFPYGIMVRWFHDLLYANESWDTSSESVTLECEAAHYAWLE